MYLPNWISSCIVCS